MAETQLPLTILHAAETIRGGIATYFNELHVLQRTTFRQVHYVVPAVHRSELVEIEDQYISQFKRTGRNFASLFRLARQTVAEVRRLKPDIVHIHSTFAGLVLRPILILMPSRPKIVYCPHGWAFSREASRISSVATSLFERLLALRTDRIICVSNDEYRAAQRAGIADDRLSLVVNGLSTVRKKASPSRSNWESDRLKVLFVGRLDRQKGFDLLIEAAEMLKERADIRMIGSPVVNSRERIQLPGNVRMLGWLDRKEIELQLDLADLTVIPSRWEAFGFVALEAMRAKKAIVAFRAGALPEIVEDGVTGIICEPISAKALKDGIEKAMELDLTKMGAKGSARFVEFFSIEKTHAALADVYVTTMKNTAR
ncbi:glycosyltransferase [Bradyrhizobium diazoefficiens]|nr:glycosyltransferase [Bradyrhizobium diazoefficiens]MBR0851315.1 glycosyltransferase [Bradyrhizobium diazoefficiens]